MEGYNAKHRNEPFRDWVGQFPVNKRVPIMERIGEFIGKSFHAVKSYRNLQREISPTDSAGIQKVTKTIAKEEGVDNFVSAQQIYPELYDAFKQGANQQEGTHNIDTTDGTEGTGVISSSDKSTATGKAGDCTEERSAA